jgi:hypothetical protein
MPEDTLFMGRYPARARHRAGLQALIAERAEGKTTQLVEWLLGGEAIDKWPSWSRVLIVPHVQQMKNVVDRFRVADQELRDRGCPGGLRKSVEQQIGIRPDMVSMTGSVFGAQPARVPFKDAKGVFHLWYAVEGVWGHLNRKPGPCENTKCADYRRPSPVAREASE